MNMKTNLKLTSAVALVITSCAITSVAGATFNVRELGAKGDGRTFDTDAIQKALDDCGKAGGGTVLLPRGTYLSKPLTLDALRVALQRWGRRSGRRRAGDAVELAPPPQ